MIATIISIGLPFVIWAILMSAPVPKGQIYEMDWGTDKGSFAYLHSYYHRLFGLIFWVGLGLALTVSVVLRAEPAGVLSLSAVYALIFKLWLSFCYESYLHHRYLINGIGQRGQSDYTRTRYAITLSLAFSSVALFVVGLLSAISAISSR